MSTNGHSIGFIARQGIALIENQTLREILDSAYQSEQGRNATEAAERAFQRLTASRWPPETLRRFLSGWRSTHGTVLFVSGMIIRLHREARSRSDPSRALIYEAAAEVGEVIPEDTGVDDTPHHELFNLFANHLVGDDLWRLDRYALPACARFRKTLKRKRLSGPLEEAILLTAASENWNTGEFTYLEPLARSWMLNVLGDAPETVETNMAYISHHAGETELKHFLHVLNAWDLYCRGTDTPLDVRKAKRVLGGYFDGVTLSFTELLDQLVL